MVIKTITSTGKNEKFSRKVREEGIEAIFSECLTMIHLAFSLSQ